MDCPEYQRQISLLVDGELDEARARTLREHLAMCPDCCRVCERMQALDDQVRSYRSLIPHPGLDRRIKERIADERTRADKKSGLPAWSRLPLAATIMLLAIGLGNVAGRSITEILRPESSGDIMELAAPDTSQSFADFVIEIGLEGNGR